MEAKFREPLSFTESEPVAQMRLNQSALDQGGKQRYVNFTRRELFNLSRDLRSFLDLKT